MMQMPVIEDLKSRMESLVKAALDNCREYITFCQSINDHK